MNWLLSLDDFNFSPGRELFSDCFLWQLREKVFRGSRGAVKLRVRGWVRGSERGRR